MLRIICGVVLVHFALAAPMDSAILAKRAVCGPDEGDSSPGCQQWKDAGYCNKNSPLYSFVSGRCGATCGLCEAAPTPPPTAGSVTVTSSDCLGAHNSKRGLHQDTPNLSWDSSLAQGAEEHAIKLAKTNPISLVHGASGENISHKKSLDGTVKTCRDAVTSWYSEIQYYDWNNPGHSNPPGEDIGHFTQVVWKSTTAVGCGVAKIVRNFVTHTVIVCRYNPPGNVQGQYGDNVKARK